MASAPDDAPPVQRSKSFEFLPPLMSELRIMMFGKSDDKKTKLGNLITGKRGFQRQKNPPCVAACGQWEEKLLTVVKTPDVFSLSVEAVREEMKRCVSLCPPGPNVLLLLVKPSDFTEENRETLKFILSLFDGDAFKYLMVVITHGGRGDQVTQLLRDCGDRHYNMSEDLKVLMEKMGRIIKENQGTFLTFTREGLNTSNQI